jgi:hypothetical protein
MTSTAPKPTGPSGPAATETPVAPRQEHIGRVVALSLAAGLVLALLLVFVVFPGDREHVTTGVLLLAFAAGWALLAALSTRRTNQPQRWAWVPAAAMGATGAVLLLFRPSDNALGVLGESALPVSRLPTQFVVTVTRGRGLMAALSLLPG